MCCAPVLVTLDGSAVNIALPSIQSDLNADLSHLQWIVIVYQVAFAVLLITCGRLGDTFGRRRLFVIGTGLFGLSSLAGALASSVEVLIVTRVLHGAGAACMIPASLALITQLFEPRERSMAIGIWSGAGGFALAAGPLVGGSLVEHVGWQAVFLVPPLVALLAIPLALWTAPGTRGEGAGRRLDYPGIALLTVGSGALMLALVDFAGKNPKTAPIVALLVIAAGALFAFVRVQQRSPAPLLRLRLFRSPTFATGNVVMFTTYALVVAQFLYITLYLQNVAGLSPLDTGVLMLPLTISVAITAPIAGRLMNRVGPRVLVTTGLLLTAAGMGLLRTELVDDARSVLTGCAFALLGGGMGAVFAAVNAGALRAVDRAYAGAAAATLSMARHLGLTFGVGLIAAAAGAAARVDLAATVERGLTLGLVVVLLTAAGAWRGLRTEGPAPLAAAAPAEHAT